MHDADRFGLGLRRAAQLLLRKPARCRDVSRHVAHQACGSAAAEALHAVEFAVRQPQGQVPPAERHGGDQPRLARGQARHLHPQRIAPERPPDSLV
jgi:hypothetical protein